MNGVFGGRWLRYFDRLCRRVGVGVEAGVREEEEQGGEGEEEQAGERDALV
jgi:hypothetical protein